MNRFVFIPLLAVASLAGAQTSGVGGTAGSIPGTAQGVTGGLSGGALLGRPPAPLGSTSTLGERIDRAAGVNADRRLGLSGSSSLGARTPGTSLGGSLSASGSPLNDAGRPAGTPFGTGTGGSGGPLLPN